MFRFQIQQLIQRIDLMHLALLFRSAHAFRRIRFLFLHGLSSSKLTDRRGGSGRLDVSDNSVVARFKQLRVAFVVVAVVVVVAFVAVVVVVVAVILQLDDLLGGCFLLLLQQEQPQLLLQ